MCAITGTLRFDGRPIDVPALRRMSGRMAHRGPDGDGSYVGPPAGPPIGLAHRRLSVLDLTAAAAQPMSDPAGAGVLCYNGEVYNYRELRARLVDQGCAFRSTGDTEVLLHACRVWGPVEAARQADGMFAFAYWDHHRRELWLARDRLGIKPLFYHRAADRVLFASEVKALAGEVDAAPDDVALAGLLLGVPTHDPLTLFRNVRAVEPGQAIRVTADGEWDAQRFFSLADAVDADLYRELDRMGDEQVTALVSRVVHRSVVMHLASDASVATMASGGVDSSLVSVLCARHLPRLTAYHADVQGPLSELEWARQLADHAGVPLHVATLTPEAYVRALPAVTLANECPVGFHPNTVPFYLVCELAAREGVKVLMTGEGADELFGGYAAFRAGVRRRQFETWKRRFGRALDCVGLGRFARLLNWPPDSGGPCDLRSRTTSLLTRGQSLRPLQEAHDAYGFVSDPIEREFHADLFMYVHSYLPSILGRNDRMGMAVGLESRVPYLENDLIRCAVNLPVRFKLRGRTNKWALRRVADAHLPPALSRRPKLGFPVDAATYVRPAPAFFRGGFLENHLGIGARQIHALGEDDPAMAFQLASAEVWGRLHFGGARPDELAERLLASLPPLAATSAADKTLFPQLRMAGAALPAETPRAPHANPGADQPLPQPVPAAPRGVQPAAA